MPRISRALQSGNIYHVLNRGNGKQTVFHHDDDYRDFLSLISDAKTRHPTRLYFYCLMPNHFHMVLSPTDTAELGKFMQWLMTSHVRRHHKRYETSGHIWQGRYKSFIIQQDTHLLAVGRYVEGNPLRAGLVHSAQEWPWSSHQELLGRHHTRLLDALPIELPANWNLYVDQSQNEHELAKLRQCLNRQAPYGSIDWQMTISKDLGLESTIRPRGRPRKKVNHTLYTFIPRPRGRPKKSAKK